MLMGSASEKTCSCAWCGGPFAPRARQQIYCGHACYYEALKARQRLRYQEAAAAGVCHICGAPASRRGYCARHAQERQMSKARIYGHRKTVGLCGECGRPAPPGYATCAACRANKGRHDVARRQARRACGLCPGCGQRPPEGYVYCDACRKRSK